MNIEEVKSIAETILSKQEEIGNLQKTKTVVDDRTSGGKVKIQIEGRAHLVDAIDLKKLLDKSISDNDVANDLLDLKAKVK